MKVLRLHPWQLSVEEAQALQRRLARQVSRDSPLAQPPRYVAGTDLSPPDGNGRVRGAAVVLSFPELRVAEVRTAEGKPGFPYIPGLLSFREAPLVLAALERLSVTPDLLLADGHGLAHPRRFGLACHLGLLAEVPAAGCAKSILCGRHGPLAPERGAWVPLEDRGEVVGAAVRTRDATSPLYVSVGHKIDLRDAVRWVLACCAGYRVPEPTRLAHLAAAGKLLERGPGPSDGPVPIQQGRLLSEDG
ncbi:MAG: deoxyribonuclease V [Chloroflexi bacterium]|nr:deoxyribonuclease V [Chloroflexota bacterium]